MEGGNPDCDQASSSSAPAIDNTCVAAVSTGGRILDVLSNCVHNEMPKQKRLEFKSSGKLRRRATNALTSGTGKLVMEILKAVNNVPYTGIAASVAIFVLEHMDKMHGVDRHRVQFLDRMWSMMKIINNVQNDDYRDKCRQMFQFVLEMSISILNKIQTTSRVSRFVFSHVDAADLQEMEAKFSDQHQGLMDDVIFSIRNDTPQVNPAPLTVTVPTTYGIEEAVEEVKTELQMGETSKKIVYTIFGMGGMGKTTLAEEVTNSLSLSNYKFCRLYIDLNSSNIAALQAQLLRDVFSTNQMVNSPSEGRTYISDAIQKNKEDKSLYIFIDDALKYKDIEDLLPIETLSKAPLKIRILITTRDSNKIPRFPRFENKNYSIRQNSAAKEILCYHAEEDLNSDFAQMKEVKMCGGIPLIIKLAGRELAKHENKAKICGEMKLSALPVDNYQIVDFVYQHLSEDSKEAFLDIPFFFLGWQKWKLLASMYTELVIKELENAALITTDKNGRVRMHDILGERAHKLSRGSRISERSEWEEAIENVKKLETIQALKLRDVDSEDININKCSNLTKLFLKQHSKNSRLLMKLCLPSSIKVLSIAGWKRRGHVTVTVQPFKHLEVLKLKYVNVEGSLNNIRKDKLAFVELVDFKEDHSSVFSLGNYPCLRHLRISRAVFEKFPGNSADICTLEPLKLDGCVRLRELESGLWQSTNLIRLNLQECLKLENLHERIVDFQLLQVLNLTRCVMLQRLPETFGSLKCLKHLYLILCERLERLPESFGELSSLVHLDMYKCSRLESLPESFGELSSLVSLNLWGCSRLVSLCDSFCKLSRLEVLTLSDCTNLSRLPESVGDLQCLKTLEMSQCRGLESLPDSLCKLSILQRLTLSSCKKLQRLPISFGRLSSLVTLEMDECCGLVSLPESFGELSSLVKLKMDACSGFFSALVSLCDSFYKLSRLEVLTLSECIYLRSLPESFGGLHRLRRLAMGECKDLEFLSISFGELSSLEYLCMGGCTSPKKLCDSFCKLVRLEELDLSGCKKLQRLPESFGDLQCLKKLVMSGCNGLEFLPESFSKLSSLQFLEMDGCCSLVSLSDDFGRLSRLEKLDLSGCKKLERLPESFGDLQCLKKLVMSGCNGLEFLPESFAKLSSLQFLEMDGCCSLVSLSDDFGRLSRLEMLDLSGCKKLERLPESFGHLSSLENLNMLSCEGLKCLPKSFGQLSCLMVLYMNGCIGLKDSLDILGNLSSLRFLILSGCSGLEKLPEDLEEFLPHLLVMDIRDCDELIRNTDLSKLVTMQSLLIILHSTSSHSSLLRPAIHVTEEVLGAQDHIIEDRGSSDRDIEVRGALRQCRSEMETLLKGKGGGGYMKLEEGGEMVWKDAVSSDVVRNGAKVLYFSPGCRCLLECTKCRLQETVEEGYEVVLVDDGICRWKRHVVVEGKKLGGEVPWNEEDKQMMVDMLSQLPHGCATVWTSPSPKICLLLTLLLYAWSRDWSRFGIQLLSEGKWDVQGMAGHPDYYVRNVGKTGYLDFVCSILNVKDIVE